MADDITAPGMLETSIEIAATAERVWAVLSDFAAYPEWNPFITRIEGKLRRRAGLTLQISLPDSPVLTIQTKLKTVSPPRVLRWAGVVLAPGLLDGEHSFEITPSPAGHCRLFQREHFSGVLAPFFSPSLLTSTRSGFEAMNQALKLRAETAERR